MKREALISPCGLYRYHLARDWSSGMAPRSLLFVMLNPSTADANLDDPTIRRCIGFAQGWGFTRVDVVNTMAFRTPSPAALCTQWDHGVDVVGPENDVTIRAFLNTASRVVLAWGAFSPGPPRLRVKWEARRARVLELLGGRPVSTIGPLTKGGEPRHPLYLKSTELLWPWAGSR